MSATALAFASGAAGACGLVELGRWALADGPAGVRRLAELVDALVRLGSEGRQPGAAERRRLLVAGALLSLVGGAALVGPLAGVALATAGPWAVGRLLRARREAYRRAVDQGASAAAMAIASGLAGGRSLRAALADAADSVPGATGHELRRVAAELEAGAPTASALEALRVRTGSGRIATLVAACLLQHRAGGDLARLLRDCAAAFDDDARLRDEVRGATAQARFTGLVVVLLPLGGAALAELASPGFLVGLWSSFLTAWLVGVALGLQLLAAVLIRRLGTVRW